MALKVAELFAELGLDSREMDRAVEQATKRAAVELREVVKAAERVGADGGRALAAGLAIDASQMPDMRRLLDGVPADARLVGADAGEAFAAAFDGRAVTLGDDLPELAAGVGADTGSALGEGILGGMPDLSGGLDGILEGALDGLPDGVSGPALAAGTAVGAMFAKGFADTIANEAETDILAARLSRFGADAEALGEVSSGLYRDAWGESMGDVNAAIDSVFSTLSESRVSDQALSDLTASAMGLAQVLDVDVSEAVTAAGVLLNTGLATDAMNAFDIITAGAESVQQSMRDEILTIFTEGEYAAAFEALGYSGEEAMGMLVAAAEQGSFQLDKTGDSVTEFTRLNQDMSAATVDAYRLIGLEADDYQAKILEGGPVARTAFLEVIAALQAVPDPADRARAALGLFGTPLGDIASDSAQLNEVLGFMASDALPNVAGAAEGNTEAFTNTAAAITTVKRELQGLFEDYGERTLNPLADLISDDDKTVADWGASLARTAGQGFTDYLKVSVLGPLGLFATNPFEDGEPGGTGSAAGSAIARAQLDDVGTAAERNAPKVDGFTTGMEELSVVSGVTGDMLGVAATGAGAFLDSLAGSTGMDDQLSAMLDLNDSLIDLDQNIGNLSASVDIGGIVDGLVPAEDTAAVLRDVIAVGGDAQQAIAAALEFQGADAARARADQIQEGLLNMFNAAGLTDEQIGDLVETMGLTDWQIEAAITLSGAEETFAVLELLDRYLDPENPDAKIPAEIKSEIDVAIAERRLDDASNLLSAWVVDMQDEALDNPILQALVAETDGATTAVDDWVAWASEQHPDDIPVDANTDPAILAALQVIDWVNNQTATFQIAARVSGEGVMAGVGRAAEVAGGVFRGEVDRFGIPLYGRAEGGPVWPGQPFLVGEEGPEIVQFGASGTVIPTDETMALLSGGRPSSGSLGAMAAAAGGSSVTMAEVQALADQVGTLAREVARKGNTFNVTAPSPERVPRYIGRQLDAEAWSRGIG